MEERHDGLGAEAVQKADVLFEVTSRNGSFAAEELGQQAFHPEKKKRPHLVCRMRLTALLQVIEVQHSPPGVPVVP